MKKRLLVLNLKLHIIFITLLTFLSFTSLFFPEPINKLYYALFVISFVSCSLVGWTAIIRNKHKKGLFSLNPITQTKASASISLNKTEKIILIYAVCIFLGCIFAALFSPALENLFRP